MQKFGGQTNERTNEGTDKRRNRQTNERTNGQTQLLSFAKAKLKNMWDIGKEVNKVTLSFLRQVLGVHKKTTNIAILSETGKYPVAMKIFVHIIKYWLRLHTTDNKLLLAAKKSNLEQDKKNKQSWTRIVAYF